MDLPCDLLEYSYITSRSIYQVGMVPILVFITQIASTTKEHYLLIF